VNPNPRVRLLLLYLAALFAFLPLAPWVWRTYLEPRLGAWLTLDAIHVGEYVILGWLLRWSRWSWTWQRPRRAIVVFALIAALDELIQGILPNRFVDVRDWLCDWIGGCVGYGLQALALRRNVTSRLR